MVRFGCGIGGAKSFFGMPYRCTRQVLRKTRLSQSQLKSRLRAVTQKSLFDFSLLHLKQLKFGNPSRHPSDAQQIVRIGAGESSADTFARISIYSGQKCDPFESYLYITPMRHSFSLHMCRQLQAGLHSDSRGSGEDLTVPDAISFELSLTRHCAH